MKKFEVRVDSEMFGNYEFYSETIIVNMRKEAVVSECGAYFIDRKDEIEMLKQVGDVGFEIYLINIEDEEKYFGMKYPTLVLA